MCKKSIRLSLYRSVLLGFLWPVPLLGLPVGFGYNQGANPYGEIGTPHFWVYHHTKAPHEGAMVANAMEAAKPFLDLWLGKKRTHKLPVVLSAKSSNASFANFVTDAIELQTLARGGRDLFWHELVHETMYRHFDSIFGTAGKVLYLPWSPAWFIEGLAEALTMSVGSDVIAATERYHARTGRWPTYDKLFNLYGNPDFFAEGYATSGAYLTWILRRGLNKDPRFLRRLLRRLTAYSSPKYYPWSLNPFSDFMPMREALRKGLGEGGRSLYATYQKEATAFWQGHTRASLMLAQPGRKKLSAWLPQFGKAPDGLQHLVSVAGRSRQQVRGVTFDASTGWWMRGDEVFETVDRRFASAHFIHREGLQVYVDDETDSFTGEKSQHLVLYDPEADSYDRWVDIEGRVQALFETVERVYWVEQKYEATRICYLPKTELEEPGSTLRLDVKCSVELRLPHHLDVLGFRYKYYPGIAVSPRASQDIPLVSELIFMDREETLHGDRFKMMVFEPSSGNLSRLNYTGGGLPTSMAVFDRHSWLLVRSATHQLLKKLDRFGACEREVILDDPVEAVQQVDHQTIALTMKAPRGYAVRRLDPQRLEGRACRTSARPTSPLLWAMGQGQLTGLRAAVKAADLWTLTQDVNQDKLVFAQERLLQIGAGLDTAKGPVGGFPAATATQTKPRAWRARPLFFFPWIGADDALGSQFGLLSVPLMDHMQNETLRASVLVGVKSRYPSTEVTLNSTRYGPTWEVSAFRRQLWTGYCQREGSTQEQGSYMDDLGTRVQATLPFFGENSGLRLRVGLRSSRLSSLSSLSSSFADTHNCEGVDTLRLLEPYASLAWRRDIYGGHHVYADIYGKATPQGVNRDREYNVIGSKVGTAVALPLLKSQLLLSLAGQRTRGVKPMNLQEYYTPLKTFIAGSGGGYNQNSYSVFGKGALFSPRFGDTKARLESAWTVPLVREFEKQVWLFSLNQLRYTMFYNYGGVWFQGRQRARDRLLSAFGNRFDLLFENKGVRFNASLGAGQVVGNPIEGFVAFGFDAFL